MPHVRVHPLPPWIPVTKLLGTGWTTSETDGAWVAEAELDRDAAADTLAQLRGLGFDGHPVQVDVRPPLKRTHVRAGRTREARARRDTTPGFTRGQTRLDEEGRFSLTPESLALELGRAYAGSRVLDLTCGAGGNSIGFARAGCRVLAVESDRRRLELARHNAAIYGVEERIEFVHGRAQEHLHHPADVLFIDPPWGAYDKAATALADLPLLAELVRDLPQTPALILKLPPSFIPGTLPFDTRVEPVFGRARGDRRRVKFLLLTRVTT